MASVAFLRRFALLCAGAMLAFSSPQDWSVPAAVDIAATGGDLRSTDLEEVSAGSGRSVAPGDRVTIRVVGHYADRSEPFADGPITFIATPETKGDLLA